VAKIETLEKLSELLGVSIPTLLGVGVEYVASAVSFFERMRQLEEVAEHIIVLAGPVSYLLASDRFDATLADVLIESIPDSAEDRDRAVAQVRDLMEILRRRKETYRQRRPGILNLISAAEIERFLTNGMIGRGNLPAKVRRERHALALAEAEHLARLMAEEPIGVQIGVVPGTLPHASFQIFRQPDRKVLTLSPFRLGEQPNVHAGVGMITSAPEALSLHEKIAQDMWRRAHKGRKAADFMRTLIREAGRAR
jgi:hypothetical protein